MNLKNTMSQIVKETLEFLKNSYKKISLFIFAVATACGFTSNAQAQAVAVTANANVSAANADGDGDANDAITTADVFSFAAQVSFQTASAAVTAAEIKSTNLDTAMDLEGAGGLTVTTMDSDKNLVITVAASSSLTLKGSSTVNAADETSVVILAGSTMTLSGGTAQSVVTAILSDSGNDGILAFTGAGAKTMAGVIGNTGTHEIGAISVAAASSVDFEATVDAVAVTNAGTITVAGASNFNTIQNSGTLAVNNTLDDIAANGNTVITQHVTGSILKFNHIAALTINANIVATTDGFGRIDIIDVSAGVAAAAQTINGDIGTTNVRIGTINVGSATVNGNFLNTDGDVIFADAINILGGDVGAEDSLMTVLDSVTATTGFTLTQSAGDATLSVTDNATITGTINNAGAAAGASILSVSGSSKVATFASAIGNTGTIDSVVIDTASAIFQDNVTATIINIDNAAGDATFTGDADQTFTGKIVATTNGEGSLIATNTIGTLTVTGVVGTNAARLVEVELNDASNVVFQSAIFTELLDINSNAAGEYVQVTKDNFIGTDNGNAGSLDIVAGAVIRLDSEVIDGTTVFNMTETAATAAGFVPAGAFTVIPSSSFSSGTVKFLDGDNADMLDSATSATLNTELALITVQDSAIIDYQVAAGTTAGGDVVINAVDKSGADIGAALGTTNNIGLGMLSANKAVNAASDSTAITAFNNALNAFNSTATTVKTDMANQIAPQLDSINGSTQAARAMTGAVQGVLSNRMASLRSGDAYVAGISAGGHGVSANSMFLQAFGSVIDQDDTKVGAGMRRGYDADTAGIAFGIDSITDGGLVVGLSLSMSNTDLEGKGTGKAKNDIDSYTASIYMDKVGEAGYVEGSVTFGISENASSRVISSGGLNRSYQGEYDSQQVSVKIGGGLPYEANNGAFITPFASVTGTLIETDAYTETSTTAADALRLRIDQDDVNSIKGTIGIKTHMETDSGTPMISLAYNSEFGDKKLISSNTYQGGGNAFKTETAVEEASATLGLGYKFTNGNTDVNIGYEVEANEDDYLSNYGTVKLTSRF
jgi:uncharacterized protein YhjY with autotransporter beta-barrel domain